MRGGVHSNLGSRTYFSNFSNGFSIGPFWCHTNYRNLISLSLYKNLISNRELLRYSTSFIVCTIFIDAHVARKRWYPFDYSRHATVGPVSAWCYYHLNDKYTWWVLFEGVEGVPESCDLERHWEDTEKSYSAPVCVKYSRTPNPS